MNCFWAWASELSTVPLDGLPLITAMNILAHQSHQPATDPARRTPGGHVSRQGVRHAAGSADGHGPSGFLLADGR
jgi:hypothetical protein